MEELVGELLSKLESKNKEMSELRMKLIETEKIRAEIIRQEKGGELESLRQQIQTLQRLRREALDEQTSQQPYKQLYEYLFAKYESEKTHNSDILSRKDKQLQLLRRKLW